MASGTPGGAALSEHEAGYRTYEVYQRERVGESTPLIKPRQLRARPFLDDPYPVLTILRENYPCYRDWHGNAFWLTRYDDVTSVFVDDANFETRSKLWHYAMEGYGRDLRAELPVLVAQARGIDEQAGPVAEAVLAELRPRGEADLALEVAARFPVELLARVLDLPPGDVGDFARRYWAMQRGIHWEPVAEEVGRAAIAELTAYFAPLVEARRADPGDDLVSAIATLELDSGPTTAEDVVVTLLEGDHETLHGSLANLWYLLLGDREQLALVTGERRMVKLAYLEALRHSPPVLAAHRYARHEVERFGRLLPKGAQVICSAGAANRDPRAFPNDPDAFIAQRKDLCQREPRGQYRADGLPTGIAFGLGPPSKHPALPEDRPRSLYAICRDTAVTVTNLLLDALPGLTLAPGASPTLRSLRVGEMHTCWHLPVTFERSG